MKSAVEMVRAFHEKMGAPVADKPTLLTAERLRLRLDLLLEEVQELVEAVGLHGYCANELGRLRDVIRQASFIDAYDDIDASDALADIAYLVIGTAVEMGLPLAEVFAEVHRSNMTKSRSDVRDDGKILKGPNFKPPRIAEILEGKLCGFCGATKVEPIRDGVAPWCKRCDQANSHRQAFDFLMYELGENAQPVASVEMPEHDPVNRPSHCVAAEDEQRDLEIARWYLERRIGGAK